MIDEIIDCINGVFEGITENQKLYGIAQTVYRSNNDDLIDFLPAVVGEDGEAKYVGIDDVESLQIYHKVNNAIFTNPARSYGDSWENQDTFNFNIISTWDNRKLKIQNIDMLMILRSRLPQQISDVKDIKQVIITASNSILNTKQIFETEYSIGKSYLLPAYINMIQINYSMQIKYDPQCINKCIN